MIHIGSTTRLRNVLRIPALNHITKFGHKNKCSCQFQSSSRRAFCSQQRADEQKEAPQQTTRLHEKIRDSILVYEAKLSPLGKTLLGIGQGLCTGGLVFGSGSLLYYALSDQEQRLQSSLSGEYASDDSTSSLPSTFNVPGALDVPEYVRDRVNTAYMYLLSSIGISGVGAVASFRLFRSVAFVNAISANPLRAIGVTFVSQILLATIVLGIPYREGRFGVKQAGSVAQALLVGLTAAPMYLLGAYSMIRAAFVTTGLLGGLTALSTTLPHDTFVNWEIPVRLGMYSVLIAFMALCLLPKCHPSYKFLYRVAMHGGLVVYPAYYLYNTKAVVRSAMYSPHFDPINAAMPLYLDFLNIYGRLSFLLPPYYFISAVNAGKLTLTNLAAEPKSK